MKRISLITAGVVVSLLLFTVCRSQQAQEETTAYRPTAPGAYDPSAGVGDHFSKFRPLHEVYARYFLFGTTSWVSRMEGERLDIIHHHFNAFTPENAMKPDHVRAEGGEARHRDDIERRVRGEDGISRGGWSFDEIDRQLALVEGMTITGHAIAWHQQSPTWLWDHPDFDADIALGNLRYHAEGVMGRFGAMLTDMDVVNEAIADSGGDPANWQSRLRQTEGWYQALGPDWVEIVFQETAKIVDREGWDVKLYYNDYNLDDVRKATAVYNMVKDINERNAGTRPNGKQLIEGIGMQAHYNHNTIAANVERSVELFSTLPGVMLSITELDITWPTTGELTPAQARRQARLYGQLLDIYRRYAAGPANPDPSKRKIERVTVWGTNDRDSWRSQAFPLLFDNDLNAKYAFMAIYDPERFAAMLADDDDIEIRRAVAMYGTPQLGTDDPLWTIAPEISVSRQPSAQGSAASAHAQVRLLWNSTHLYVRADVTDPALDRTSPNAWEQDSVEIFMSESVHRQPEYRSGDGQYRVAYHGEATFRDAAMGNGFSSHAEVTETGYLVEMRIPFRVIRPERGSEISLDVQINDVSAGPATRLLTIWSDETANGFNTTANWGDIRLEQSVPGIHIPALAGGEGANIILGNNANVWPYASTTRDGQIAFTPERNGRYRLSFNATSIGANGYRVRWIRENDNTSYTVADAAVVTTAPYTFQIGQTADRLPASWSGVAAGSTQTFTMEFVMDGNAQRDGLIGNIGIRGLFGSRAFTLNWIRLERLTASGAEIITEWPVFDAAGGHF